MAQTIGFETKQAWQASAGEVRSDNWITISPTSGPAGKNNISVTLTSNTSENSRTAVITITSGSDSVEITITQRGTGDPEEPEDPEQPEDPTHPEVTPENRLTLVEQTFSETYNSGTGLTTRNFKSFMELGYDAQGRLASGVNNSLNEDYTDMLDGTTNMTINWAAEKITMNYKDFYINTFSSSDGTDNEQLLYGRRSEYTEEFLRNKDGFISRYTDPDGDQTEYTYNADKTLKSTKRTYKSGSGTETTTYTWKNGNIINVVNTNGLSTDETTFTYTEHPNPWQGVDMAALCSDAADDSAMLLGIGGLSTKNLPATKQNPYGTTRFEYTFDAQGRLSTAVSAYTSNSSSTHTERTESKFHYGEVSVPSYPVIPYVIKQEITDEGTLDYTFDKENEHFVSTNAYTSFVKIHSTLTDGTTHDQTVYSLKHIPDPMPEGGPRLPDIAVEQQQVDNFRLIDHSLTEDYLGENVVNPHRFTCTLDYNCFSVDMKCEVNYSYYNIYSATTGNIERRTMPMRPFTKECIIVYQPELQVISKEEGIYEFTQKFAVQITPGVEPEHISEISRMLTTKTR